MGRGERREAGRGWGAAGEPTPGTAAPVTGPTSWPDRDRGPRGAGHCALRPSAGQRPRRPAVPCRGPGRSLPPAMLASPRPGALPRTAAWRPLPALPPRPTAGDIRRAVAAPLPGPPSPPWPGEGSGTAPGTAPPRPGLRGSRDRHVRPLLRGCTAMPSGGGCLFLACFF